MYTYVYASGIAKHRKIPAHRQNVRMQIHNEIAKYFNVTTDYLPGLTDIRERQQYETPDIMPIEKDASAQ